MSIYCILVLLLYITLPKFVYPCSCHMLVNYLLNLTRCLAVLRIFLSVGRKGNNGLELSHLPGYPWLHMNTFGFGGRIVSWSDGMVGPRETSLGHSPLRSIKDRPWMTSILRNLLCYHISNNSKHEPITFFDLAFDARS